MPLYFYAVKAVKERKLFYLVKYSEESNVSRRVKPRFAVPLSDISYIISYYA